MSFIGVIPARRQSKGLKFKNRLKIDGESITRRAIKIALKAKCKIVVLTTDDEKLIKENKDIAEIVLRKQSLSSDTACSFEVWRDAVLKIINKYKLNKNYFSTLLLEPTSPNRKLIDLENIKQLHLKNNCNVLTLSELNKSYSPEKIMKIDKGITSFYLKNGINFLRRQKIKNYYYRNGICYACKADIIVKKNPKKNFYLNCQSMIINREVVNIDNKSDLKFIYYKHE